MTHGPRRRVPWAGLCLVGALLAGPGGAGGAGPDPRAAARRALEAVREEQTAGLEALAADPGEDPFLVTVEILGAPPAALGGPADDALRLRAAEAYAQAVERARPSAGRVLGWLARLRAVAPPAPPDSPRARLQAYGAASLRGDAAAVAAERDRWRGPLPDLAGDPHLLLLARTVAADWHDSYPEAAALVRLAPALVAESVRIGWSELEGFSRWWLAEALHVARRDPEARREGLAGARRWKDLGRGDRAAWCLLVVAEACEMVGDLAAMQRALEEAHGLSTAARDEVAAAHALRQLATAAHQQGRVAEAVSLFERAIEDTRRLGIPANLSNALAERASMWSELGNHDRALADAREGLALADQTGDAHSAAAARLALGMFLRAGGRLAEAREAMTAAVSGFQAVGARREAAEATSQLVGVLTGLKDPDAAAAAVAAAEKDLVALGDRTTLGNLHLVWSDLLWDLGRHDEAVALLARAREEFEAAGVLQGVALALGNRGLRLGSHRYPEARASLEEAIALWTRLERPEMVARNVERLAALELDLRSPLKALRHVRRCLETRLRLGSGLGDDEALGGAQSLHRVLGVGVLATVLALEAATVSRERLLDDATWFAESGSGLFLSRGLSERRELLAVRADPALTQADAKAHERVRAALAGLADGVAPREAAQVELDAAYVELESVVARVQREARRVAELVYPRPRARAEIAAALAEDEALVLYLTERAATCVVVVRRRGTQVLALAPTDLEAATAELLRAIQAGDGSERATAARLHETLVRPLEPALGGVKRLLLCPDGPLHLLPFAALAPEEPGGARRLGERFEIGYVPSGTVLLALEEARAGAGPSRGVVALGDPLYPSEGRSAAALAARGAPQGSAGGWLRLPETADEARALAGRFPRSEGVLLLREEASRERLLAVLAGSPRRQAVHLACHALLDVAHPRLCGVALAGGDLLTADDIDRIDVPADLVVLSACETGRGRIQRGEGVAGLTRSFLLAGASRVLVSLWKVDDRATRLLMDAFYDGLFGRGLPASAALVRAQQVVRDHEEPVLDPVASRARGRDVLTPGRPYAAPRYWAAWSLWGLAD